MANRDLSKKGSKIFAFFADKTAFDKIDRRKLNKIMKRIGMEDNLRGC